MHFHHSNTTKQPLTITKLQNNDSSTSVLCRIIVIATYLIITQDLALSVYNVMGRNNLAISAEHAAVVPTKNMKYIYQVEREMIPKGNCS